MRLDKPTTELADEQLMKLYQNGHEGAFKVLYERHSAKVFGFLKSRVSNKEKMQEIYQEVFVKIHKSKHLFNDSLPLLPWIFTITRTVLIDELRKNKNVQISEGYDLEKIPSNGASHQLNSTAELIDKLPNYQKTALEMRYVSDRTFEEIAASLQVSPSNARQIISRGVKRLRQLISEGGES